MLASGRPPASTVPAYCRSIKRPVSLRQRCRPTTAVLVSPSPTPIPRRKATGRRLDPTSSDPTPRPNPHRARGTDGAPTSRDFVPRRFSDAGRSAAYKGRHCRRPKTCTNGVYEVGSRDEIPGAIDQYAENVECPPADCNRRENTLLPPPGSNIASP